MHKVAVKFLIFSMLFTMCLCAYPSSPVAQMQFYRPRNSDSLVKLHINDTLVNKRFGRAALLWSATEILPWAYDKYVAKADFANISFNTLRTNLNPRSWFWDDDDFLTNQFAHPSHGSVFFNAFRSNGYSFWQSVPAVFAGSYVWETAGETQAPSINDFINTGFGGVVMGETLHRFAGKIINNRSRGFKRQVSEVFGLVLDPANGLNRILDGKWGKLAANDAQHDSSKIYAEFDLGARRFKVNNQDGNFGWYGHIKLIYGTPYAEYKTPFSYIFINTEFGRDDKSVLNIISIAGSLTGFWVQSTDKIQQMALLSANYDYINNEAFFYSSQNIKLNLFSEFVLSNKLKINTSFGAGPVILAAVPDPYIYDGRNYDFCTGAAFNGSAIIGVSGKFFYGVNYRGGWFKTLSGNSTDNFVHTVTSEVRYMVVDGVSICAEPGYFTLKGYYKNSPDVDKTYPYLRLSVRYNLNLQ